MTAKESARQIATKYRWPKPPSDTLVEMIESAITAAVKEEREACAKIADNHVRVARELGEKSGYAELIRNQIRARSEAK